MTDNQPLSRRQRLLGLARSTRDNYMPKITGSMSSLATGASRAFANPEVYDENGRIILPKDTTIQLFPSYTRKQDGKYFVGVQGWVFAPGVMNRKNRVVFSVIKQIMKQRETTQAQLTNLENDSSMKQDVFNPDSASNSDTESIMSVDSTQSSQGSNGSLNPDDVMKERLSSFFAKSIPNTELVVTIGSEATVDELVRQTIQTDGYGHFETTVEVPYKPSVVQVASGMIETVFTFQDVMIYANDGVGVISDIDDTIKLTGVIGEKMVLLRNLLTNEVGLWAIPEVTQWYGDIYKDEDVNFFYVSNSPWQLFDTIKQYFLYAQLPPGSVHLKRYSGNIIASLLEPSQSRKKRSLHKILLDFPDKKFVCVGDSGEYDLEAYVDIAKTFPNQVLSINIRYVEDSFSDVDDHRIYTELMRLLTTKKKEIPVTHKVSVPPKRKPPPSLVDEEMEDLIDLSDDVVKKPAPMIPRKPTSLKGHQLERKLPPPPPSPRKTKPQPSIHEVAKSYTDPVLLPPPNPLRSHLLLAQLNSLLRLLILLELLALLLRKPKPPPSSNVASDGNSISDDLPPLPPRRHQTSPDLRTSQSSDSELDSICNSPGFYDLEEMDRKGANWIRRIITAIRTLEDTNTKIIIFKDEEADFFKKSTIELDELRKK
ncbi:Phosphatidate phosphatase APP1 [Candida viswanathii]|uniref:Phosphatidate phosphatase APP1 n=1 Tax=Candida viswanathii TaxID=5486 RepID=A0A367YMJ5_9ASCO|nr:Phosphatidate phosphatase APP1 [Candida viswanathii]